MRRPDPALWALRAVVALFIVFMLAPILIVVVTAFTSAGYVAFPIPGLSLRWFQRIHLTARDPSVKSAASSICSRAAARAPRTIPAGTFTLSLWFVLVFIEKPLAV